VKIVGTLMIDGSHQRVTDAATSAALGDLSTFEIPGLLRQARSGDDSAAFMMGMAYETGRGVPQNCGKAARWVKEAAMGGEAAAEYNLSLRYRDGDGLLANSQESEKWARKAAEQNYTEALTKAGVATPNQTHAALLQP
jgi:TPR repeat protein